MAPPQDPALDFRPDPGGLLPPVGAPASGTPSQAFRVQRRDDLVNLQVTAFGLTATATDDGLVLVAADGDGRLEVRFPFQHLGEQAFYEDGDAGPPVEPPIAPPVQALAAEGSRLVLTVPTGERIAYSVEGVLAAVARLPLVVVPLATPRQVYARVGRGPVPGLPLPGGHALRVTDLGMQLERVRSAKTRAFDVPGLVLAAGQVRAARVLLGDRAGADPLARAGGHALDDLLPVPPVGRRLRQRPRAPRSTETAIEAPYRLVLSPSSAGGFAHAVAPQAAPDDARRVELWQTRLGTRSVVDGVAQVSEVAGPQKAVRAVWARDLDGVPPTAHDLVPFRMSLDGLDRAILVRQSADPTVAVPEPVTVDRLALSALGAWLDLHGAWHTDPYTTSPAHLPAIESWDHRAPMGRDSYVKVTYPGYLYPFGHRCSLVKVTERRVADGPDGPVAWLFQHTFLVVREPVRAYADADQPFREVRLDPLTTPWLMDPLLASTPFVVRGDQVFWPAVAGAKLRFTLHCVDADGRRVRVQAPLLFVADGAAASADDQRAVVNAYLLDSQLDADGQSIAFAPSRNPGDAAAEAVHLRFSGVPAATGSRPLLSGADVVVPAMKHLSPTAPPVAVKYADRYVAARGFGGADNVGEVFLELDVPAAVSFGGGTDRAGGFLSPDLPVRGLSRTHGAVGDVTAIAQGAFDPTTFFSGVLPKLFGLFELTDLLAAAGLDKAPAFVSDAVDAVAAMLTDLAALQAAVGAGAARLAADAAAAPTAPLRAAASKAQADLEAATTTLDDAVTRLTAAVSSLLTGSSPPADPVAALTALLTELQAIVGGVAAFTAGHSLPTAVTAVLERPLRALQAVLAAGALVQTVEAVLRFVRGVDPAGLAVRASYEWTTRLRNFSFDGGADPSDADALFVGSAATLHLSVDVRASGAGTAGSDVLAEITTFRLNLLPGQPLVRLVFDRIAFRAATGRKADVDVVFGGLEFCGVLGFVQTLKDLIPADGFSDPPFLDVSPAGLTAGFDLALPSIGIGVFSLENLSLHADTHVPFLGDAVTVGFSFCTRERPFCLTVMAIGGGGFVGVRLSPKGLVLLEMALEAGACLSVDLGVASGSVSVMVGVYLRLEGKGGCLTGYFRIRGEVDVLGLISASITLELSLTYDFDSGKMIGRASLDIEVEVFLLSFSVTVTAERRLAGANGDPTLEQMLLLEPDGTSPAWSDYCGAFAPEPVG